MTSEMSVTRAHASTLDAEHPWPGLDAFPESGSRYFHGRAREVDRLVRLVRDEPLVLLHGESGLGKTSLLQAGVFPRLRAHDLVPVLVRLDFSPGATSLAQQVRDRLVQELDREHVDGPRPALDERLWEFSHGTDGWLWSPRQTVLLPVIVLDQFEELFTLGGGLTAAGARDFVDELAEVVLDRAPNRDVGHLDDFDRSRPGFKVVLSFREEFLAHIEQLLPEFGAALQTRLRLTALDVPMAERAVLGNGGALVDEYVAHSIVHVVSGGREFVEPSLLSVFCRELNERRLAARAAVISRALVDSAGAAVLPEFYARSTGDLPEPVLEFVEEKLLTEGQRRNIVTLEEALAAPGVTLSALERLVRRRLIRIEERFGSERVELAHDVLAPIVGEVRRERRARREERRLNERLEVQRREAEKVAKEQARLRRFLIVSIVGVALATAAGGVAMRAQRSATAEKLKVSKMAEVAYLFDAAEAATEQLRAANAAAALEVAIDPAAASAGVIARLSAMVAPLVQVQHAGLDGGPLVSARYSADGQRFVTASADHKARIWDAETGAQIGRALEHSGPVTSARFSTDGKWVVTASDDGTARVWRASDGTPYHVADTLFMRPAKPVNAAVFSPNGAWVATASDDSAAQVWDATTLKRIGTTLRHPSVVHAVTFSADGTTLLTTADDNRARLWNWRNGAMVGVPLAHAARVNSAVFSTDGGRVVTASADGTARVWDGRTGAAIGKPLEAGSGVNSAAFSPDGMRVVTATSAGRVQVWNAPTAALAATPAGPPMEHANEVTSALFDATGAQVVTATVNGTAKVWDARTMVPIGPSLLHLDAVLTAEFSPNGRQVLTASADSSARIWDARTQNARSATLRHPAPVEFAIYSPDGTRVLTAATDNSARLWNARSGKQIGNTIRRADKITAVAFSPDGARVLVASNDGRFALCTAATGDTLFTRRHNGVDSAAFSPDGKKLVTIAWDGSEQWWDTFTGLPIGAMRSRARVRPDAVMSPDLRLVLVIGADKTARVRDAKTGDPLAAPLRDTTGVLRGQFSPDRSRVVTIATGDQAQIWDRRTGAPLGPALRHLAAVNSAVFSPDGQRVLTASEDSTARIWDARTVAAEDREDLVNLAGQVVGGRTVGPRNFAPDLAAQLNRGIQQWRKKSRGWSDAPDGSFKQWVHWYFADPTTRPDQPGLWRGASKP